MRTKVKVSSYLNEFKARFQLFKVDQEKWMFVEAHYPEQKIRVLHQTLLFFCENFIDKKSGKSRT